MTPVLHASAANRTRGPSMATMDFTTKPLALEECHGDRSLLCCGLSIGLDMELGREGQWSMKRRLHQDPSCKSESLEVGYLLDREVEGLLRCVNDSGYDNVCEPVDMFKRPEMGAVICWGIIKSSLLSVFDIWVGYGLNLRYIGETKNAEVLE